MLKQACKTPTGVLDRDPDMLATDLERLVCGDPEIRKRMTYPLQIFGYPSTFL